MLTIKPLRKVIVGVCGLLVACSAERAPGESETSKSQDAPIAVQKKTPALWDVENGANWAGYGRTHYEDHYSPLDQINDKNVGQLGLAWSKDLPSGVQTHTAPLAIDGVLFYAIGYSVVYAVEAATGAEIWSYDPEVTEVAGEKLRQAWGIRGLAYGHDKIFVGTQDGRLIALKADTGHPVWSVDTTQGPNDGRFISGSPRVFTDKVIIGHGGAEHANVRGYVTAYDVDTGELRWRFYTVPGNPADGFENDAMKKAAATWKGEWWRFGGGGTVWNAMTYDPELNRVYIGSGNGAPWNQKIRSPGGGDNLFLCSVIALDADTGAYIWHYQTTPGETWDFNSAMDIQLASLEMAGKKRRVLLHAPKNGFFYVIDRDSGELISAEPFVKVNWASHIDLATGRPVESPRARQTDGSFIQYPGMMGGHNWMAMAYSPQTQFAYIPTTDLSGVYDDTKVNREEWKRGAHIVADTGYQLEVIKGVLAEPEGEFGSLLAWDPITQKAVWSVPFESPFNGGVAATAGNLVFQGNAEGKFVAYAADTGEELWSFNARNGILAQPITYEVDGVQYVTVLTGFGGGAALLGPISAKFGWDFRNQERRILTFKIGGSETLPSPEPIELELIEISDFEADEALVEQGGELYAAHCLACHGVAAVAGGGGPDLRTTEIPQSNEVFAEVVRGGMLEVGGMPKFDEITDQELAALQHYLLYQTHVYARAGASK